MYIRLMLKLIMIDTILVVLSFMHIDWEQILNNIICLDTTYILVDQGS